MSKVVIFDTSILCVYLAIPGKSTCGPQNERWDRNRVDEKFRVHTEERATFVMPLAAIIETGNHISQCNGDRYALALSFCDILAKIADATTPWAAFTDQATLWDSNGLRKISQTWPEKAVGKLSIGDATIKEVADYYSSAGFDVEIFTGDEGLKSYEPRKPTLTPRRRR